MFFRNFTVFYSVLFIFYLGFSSAAFAAFLPELYEGIAPIAVGDAYFVSPNEEIPGSAKVILSGAAAGVYISVGTERGFIGAAISPHVTHLLLTDYDSGIVRFNRINIALLKASRDRSDYLILRRYSSAREWQQRASEDSTLDEESRSILSDATLHWWFDHIHRNRESEFYAFFTKPGEKKDNPYAFEGANYLYDDSLFHRLQDLARQDKIQSIQLDFSNSEKLSHVMEALKNAHLPISVFDLSNAWHEAYQIGVEGLKHLVNQVRGQALPNSILLLTNNVYIQSKIGPQYRIGAFGYIGASFEKILPGSKAERKFYDYLRRIETHDNGDYTDLFIHGSLDISKTSVMNPHGRLPDEVVYSGYKFKKNGKAESRSVHRSDCMDSVYSKK